jgi:hypothetical protein
MFAFFGIGQTELIIVLAIGCVLALPVILALVVVAIFIAAQKRRGD